MRSACSEKQQDGSLVLLGALHELLYLLLCSRAFSFLSHTRRPRFPLGGDGSPSLYSREHAPATQTYPT